MMIGDLEFQNNLQNSSQVLGGQGGFDNVFENIKKQLQSLTGQVVGTLNTISTGTAFGTSEADISVLSDLRGETANKVYFALTTLTSGFASTPGS